MNTICPYNPRKPIYDINLFVGRTLQLSLLLGGLSKKIINTFAVIGGRRTGKSSSLLKVQASLKNYENSSFTPVYYDLLLLSAENSEVDFYKRLVNNMRIELGISVDTSQIYGFSQFDKLLSEYFLGEKTLVLLFDEIEALLNFEWAASFFANLRNSINSLGYRVSIVIVAFDWEQVQQKLLRSWVLDFKKIYLEPFDQIETHELINLSFPHLRFSKDAVQKLYEQTGGHPYLLQKLLEEIWVTLQGDISLSDIDKVVNWFFQEEDTSFERWYSDIFKYLEDQIVLNILAKSSTPVPEKQFQEIILNIKELKLTLNRCVDSCLVTVDAERNYYLRCSMFRQWLLKRNILA